MMNFILKTLRMTCEDTSPLISEMMDHEISLFKRWRIRIHLAVCGVCVYYKKQLEIIQNLAKNLGREDVSVNEKVTLRPECKEKLRQMIKASK